VRERTLRLSKSAPQGLKPGPLEGIDAALKRRSSTLLEAFVSFFRNLFIAKRWDSRSLRNLFIAERWDSRSLHCAVPFDFAQGPAPVGMTKCFER